ncbi:hypothetical protein RJI07_05940 [Mycoplasmatota bacterium WC30]
MRYNWDSWQNKFGFSSLEKIRDTESVSRYITKYITKDLFIEFNKQRYLGSKGLKKPETFFEQDNYTNVIPCDFENDYVRTLNINSYERMIEVVTYILDTEETIRSDEYAIE